jgi:ferritin-like metal-binding protein YciE
MSGRPSIPDPIHARIAMKMHSLQDLLFHQIRDLYDAERQLVRALPKMVEAAETPELKSAFEAHLRETQGHVKRLEEVFDLLGHQARGTRCPAMEGIIEEGRSVIDLHADADVRDAGLIAAAQKVEHYEIAGYGCVCAWADQLGLREIKALLGKTLDEEKRADEKLTRVAERRVNMQSAAH